MVEKWKYQKWWRSIFNEPFIIKQVFVWPQFATALLSLAYITHIDENKYFIFVKLKNTGQINGSLTNLVKAYKDRRFTAKGHRNVRLSAKVKQFNPIVTGVQ